MEGELKDLVSSSVRKPLNALLNHEESHGKANSFYDWMRANSRTFEQKDTEKCVRQWQPYTCFSENSLQISDQDIDHAEDGLLLSQAEY